MEKLKIKSCVDSLWSPEKRQVLIPSVEVFFNTVITSAHAINTDNSKLIMSNKDLSLKQVVVAAGSNSSVKVGDWVKINPETFPYEDVPGKNDVGTIRKVKPPLEKIGNTEYFVLSDRHIKYKYITEEL